ncbi:MAG: hypothetical protein HN336_04225 [Lentimicrobiaceae bacterium]|jgi:hypothetical protein|nr:hypothetical protein [Lentimicrobiaceae bacterium]MCP4911248.1 hypothetical protein [Bacteroidota bacterium]MBT3453958.1 hypothetical protein [Lentimicrobiaceae bacterium]MBT3818569.1 hypothetical protein [Lentimicrobiaceae bacterium]MBT4061935.1 hypothetical protein [Lentimicrobiaceae bacterium]
MIKFTPKQHQKSSKPLSLQIHTPSELSMKIIYGYAAALTVKNTDCLGSIDILLN